MRAFMLRLLIFLTLAIGGGSLLLFTWFLLFGSPCPIDIVRSDPGRLVWDSLLCFVFFIQHSGMIRRSAKERMAKYVPAIYHPALYSIASGLALSALILLWQPAGQFLWHLHGAGRWLSVCLAAAAIAGFIWGIRALGEFDPFGTLPLKAALGRACPPPVPFVARGPYRYVRHPLYFFMLVLIWSTPRLPTDQVLFNVLWTVWIILGSRLEERDLLRHFGDTYREYQLSVPMLLPLWRPARPQTSTTNKRQPFHFLAIAALSLMVSSSDAHSDHESAILPADIPINRGAGRGGYLKVTLHLEGGDDFPCVLDTGSPGSLLPQSVEPKLGKRVGSRAFRTLGGPRETAHIYATPKLYLGRTPLVTGATIGTWKSPSGVLGMDCLRHYCIQLDFQAGKLRFLDPERVDHAALGTRLPLTSVRYAYIRHRPLLGQKTIALLVDTGSPFDGIVDSELFKRAVRDQDAQPTPLLKDGVPAGTAPGIACLRVCAWNGVTYTNIVIQPGRPELLGLRFLARHTVTFNFPKKVMYLKITTGAPLPPEPPR